MPRQQNHRLFEEVVRAVSLPDIIQEIDKAFPAVEQLVMTQTTWTTSAHPTYLLQTRACPLRRTMRRHCCFRPGAKRFTIGTLGAGGSPDQ
jgi:hypothetical protein